MSKIRCQVKEFNLLCMGRCKPLGLLNSVLSYEPWPSGAHPLSLFIWLLAFPSSSAVTVGGGCSTCWITIWGARIHIWRPEIADGYDIFCLLKWQEICSFHAYTYIQSCLDFILIWVTMEHWVEFLVLYSRFFLLVIYLIYTCVCIHSVVSNSLWPHRW